MVGAIQQPSVLALRTRYILRTLHAASEFDNLGIASYSSLKSLSELFVDFLSSRVIPRRFLMDLTTGCSSAKRPDRGWLIYSTRISSLK
ncbi:hypothetical protein BDV18DRAFT_149512, partial [Aspergillus unguis]